MLSGNTLLHAERRKRFAMQDAVLSSVYVIGQVIPVGTPVLVTALHTWSSFTNVLHLRSGGAQPADSIYSVRIDGDVVANVSFKNPLLFDGLAAEWEAPAGSVRLAISYRILEA